MARQVGNAAFLNHGDAKFFFDVTEAPSRRKPGPMPAMDPTFVGEAVLM